MSVIAEYRLSSDRIALAPTFEAVPAMELELERSFATDPYRPVLFAWGSGPLEAFERVVADDPTVEDLSVLDTAGGKRLYRIAVSDETDVVLYNRWVELGAERLEAHYTDDWWHGRIRFPDRAALTEYRGFLEENGVDFRLKRLYDAGSPTGTDLGLTDEQRETLVLAHDMGYFDIPRGTTTSGLAEELDISNQAVSERLRRGYRRLVEQLV